MDNYENLPLKTRLGYQFLAQRCSNYDGQVLYIDDDTFVRFDLLDRMFSDKSNIVCMKGYPIYNYAVSYVGKYYVWADQWPSSHQVPKYCNGQCVGMYSDSARRIYEAAAQTDLNDFRLEDFFFSGILRKKAELPEPKGLDEVAWGQEFSGMAACLHTKAATYDEIKKVITRYQNGRLEMRYEQ